MRDTLNIECLIQALDQYMAASREEAEAREKYEGPSWGYFGRDYIETKEKAAEEVQKRLDQYIDARIEAKICGQAGR